MPEALARKYPRAASAWSWFWVFPRHALAPDPRGGQVRRHHVFEQSFQRGFKRAVERAGIVKPATPHTLRHSFATHLLQSRYDSVVAPRVPIELPPSQQRQQLLSATRTELLADA